MSTVIGVFDDQRSAENALNELEGAGIGQEDVSIIAKEDTIQGGGAEGENDLTTGITAGGAIGGLTGLLAGAGALTIPGIGPILAAGPIAAGLTGVAAGGLAGSLVDLGVDAERGEHYEQQVQQGRILATVEVTEEKTEEISNYLRQHGAREVEAH